MKKILIRLLPWAFIIAPAIAVLNGTASPDGLATSINMLSLIVLAGACTFAGLTFFAKASIVDIDDFDERAFRCALLWRKQMQETSKLNHIYCIVVVGLTIVTSSMIGNALHAFIYSLTEAFLLIQMNRLSDKGKAVSEYYELTDGEIMPVKSWNLSRMNADYDRFTKELQRRDRTVSHIATSTATKPAQTKPDPLDPLNPLSPFSPLNPLNHMPVQSTADHSECVSRSRNDDCSTGYSGGGSSGGND